MGKRRRLGAAAAVAALVHVNVLVLVGWAAYAFAPRFAALVRQDRAADAMDQPLAVTTIDDETARRIAEQLVEPPDAEHAKDEPAKKKVDDPHPQGQVVSLPPPRQERRPDQSRYLSEHDVTVDKETRRRGPEGPQGRESPGD